MTEDNLLTKVDLENETPHFGNTLLGAVPSEVFNEDCITVMKRYPDKFFDLAVVDPPYGIGEDGEKKRTSPKRPNSYTNYKKHAKKSWDKEPPSMDYFNELFRVSKNQIVWGANHFIIPQIC